MFVPIWGGPADFTLTTPVIKVVVGFGAMLEESALWLLSNI